MTQINADELIEEASEMTWNSIIFICVHLRSRTSSLLFKPRRRCSPNEANDRITKRSQWLSREDGSRKRAGSPANRLAKRTHWSVMICLVPKNVVAPGEGPFPKRSQKGVRQGGFPERSQFGREDGSKRNQPQMTQINADELKRPVKRPEIPSSSSAVICVICG
jgi:hypothetical protein